MAHIRAGSAHRLYWLRGSPGEIVNI